MRRSLIVSRQQGAKSG